jgi:Cytochrome c554 and c-prime
MLRRHASALAILAATLTFVVALAASLRARALMPRAAEASTPRQAAGSFTGPGSCAASACHGAVRPVPGSRILQTEYSTWIAQDRHARAAEVLTNAVSVRMAKILGIGRADAAPKCLACHSLAVPEGRQARTFENEGVSCEACHGPASGWLGPHTTRGWTHAQSVQLGMTDTKDPVRRTEQCLTCHLGTAEKFVDHEMIAAGHPDLVFDVEAFSAAMPRHWRENTDQEPFRALRIFSVGQLVHARSAVDRLVRRVKGPVWPEYAELECFACHHSLTRPEDSWRQSQGYANRRPGNPPLNLSRWTTARHVLAAYDEAGAADLDAVMLKLAAAASRLRTDENDVAALAGRARELLDRAITRVTAAPADAAAARRMLHALAGAAEEIAPRGERAAEQAAMAMESLHDALARAGGTDGGATKAAFNELFQQFESPSSYEPRRFVAQVKKIESIILR